MHVEFKVSEFTILVETNQERELIRTALLYYKDNANQSVETQAKIIEMVQQIEAVPAMGT